MSGRKVLIASPRGWCAGVDRAVVIVEKALDKHGAPVYVRKEIVHNARVVKDLEARGAIFVDSEQEIPEGSMCVFSAHGVSPEVRKNAESRHLNVIDATCPLVTKVHVEARRFASQGKTIFLIGHNGHEEVEGTHGEAPDRTVVVENAEQVATLQVDDPSKVAFVSQTTLAVDDTLAIRRALRERFPQIAEPTKEDICYASQNRQEAVKAIAEKADVVFVVGSENSSNSNRLVEVAREHGARSHLIEDGNSIDPAWLEGADVVGISSGASTPEILVESVLATLAQQGIEDVEEIQVAREDIEFPLPAGL